MYILLLANGDTSGIYNVGSGVGYRLGDLLNKILSFINVPVQVEVDGALERSQDTTLLVADTTKLSQLTAEHQLQYQLSKHYWIFSATGEVS